MVQFRLVCFVLVGIMSTLLLGACGGSGSSGGSITPRFGYVLSYGDSSVSSYAVDLSTWTLSNTGVKTAGTGPLAMAVSSDVSYAYVANFGNDTISEFSVNSDGTLKDIGTAISDPTVTISSPIAIAIDATVLHAYVVNSGNDTVSQFNIGIDGQLSPMIPDHVNTEVNPRAIVISPNGKYAYVVNKVAAGLQATDPQYGTISQYTVDSKAGLTPMTTPTVKTGAAPYSMAITPDGMYAYVVNYNDHTIWQYSISVNGELTDVTPASPPSTGAQPQSIVITANGKYLYVNNANDNTVSQFTIGANGVLSPMTPDTVKVGNYPQSITLDPGGHAAYVTNYNDATVSQFIINGDGTLKAATPSTITVPTKPVAVTMVVVP